MHVQMGDRLADHVVDRDEGALGAQRGAEGRGHPLRRAEHRHHQLGRQVQQVVDVADRGDQHVALEHRPVVQERDHVVVPDDHRRVQLAGDDLADDVGHGRIASDAESATFDYRTVFDIMATMSTSAYAPPGWPDQVRPPGAPHWEADAVAYLLDCCPADFRAYVVLRNHPVVLAQFASALRRRPGRGRCRTGWRRPGPGCRTTSTRRCLEEAAQAWLEQAARLARTRRAVALIDEALRGRTYRAPALGECSRGCIGGEY